MLSAKPLISRCQTAGGMPAISALPPPSLVCQPEHQAVIAVASLLKHIAELSYSHCCPSGQRLYPTAALCTRPVS